MLQRVIDKKWSVNMKEGYKMNIVIAKLITNVILDFQCLYEDAGQEKQEMECQQKIITYIPNICSPKHFRLTHEVKLIEL